ncbi:MAG: sigma-70 family RNA polymerase sigma factor [Polyangiaceae bacterium]
MESWNQKQRRFYEPDGSKPGMLATASGATAPIQTLRAPGTLVRECVAGDISAWRSLHRDYSHTVVAFLRRLGVSESDIDDASQEVFLQLFRSLGQFRGDCELKTWIYRLCATHASRLRRRKRLLTRIVDVFTRASDTEPAAKGTEEALVARTLLDRAMTRLSERERLVFVLFELEGLSGAEVAAIAGCPINTVWRRLSDARRRLKEALEQDSR